MTSKNIFSLCFVVEGIFLIQRLDFVIIYDVFFPLPLAVSTVLFVTRIKITFGFLAMNIPFRCSLLRLRSVLFVDCDRGWDTKLFIRIAFDSICLAVEFFGLRLNLSRNCFDTLPGWIVDLSL